MSENSLVRRLRQFQADEPGFPPLFSAAASEIELLKRRVAVLEQVIYEELSESGCQDAANEMIADEISNRLGSKPPSYAREGDIFTAASGFMLRYSNGKWEAYALSSQTRESEAT